MTAKFYFVFKVQWSIYRFFAPMDILSWSEFIKKRQRANEEVTNQTTGVGIVWIPFCTEKGESRGEEETEMYLSNSISSFISGKVGNS
jgi:hypothetical protein